MESADSTSADMSAEVRVLACWTAISSTRCAPPAASAASATAAWSSTLAMTRGPSPGPPTG